MATELDIKLVPKARQLIERFGLTVNYRRVTAGGVYNPTTGTTSTPTETLTTIKVTPPFPVKNDLVDGDVYKYGDHITYLADENLGFVPEPGRDNVEIGEERLTVVGARPIRSGELVAIWELQLRKN